MDGPISPKVVDRIPSNERLETFEEQLERGATAATPTPTGELLP